MELVLSSFPGGQYSSSHTLFNIISWPDRLQLKPTSYDIDVEINQGLVLSAHSNCFTCLKVMGDSARVFSFCKTSLVSLLMPITR